MEFAIYRSKTWVIVLTVCLAVGASGAKADTFEELVRPVLNTYCVDCHGPDVQEARLRYDQIDEFRISDRHLWTMIHEQLSDDAMPPEDELQLSASEKEKILR